MDSNGRGSPDVKNSHRSRSRSPVGGRGNDRHSSRGRTRNRSQERQSGGSRRNAPIACRRVYIANIAFDAKWTDVKDLFKEQVGDVAYVQLFEDESGKFRGCGVVELKDSSSVQKAIDILHRYEFRGRKLVIKEDYDLERDKSGRLIPSTASSSSSSRDRNRDRSRDNYGGNNSDMMNFNTYGLSPQFLDSLGINGPLSSKVFIANLDFKVTTKKLHEVFKMAGKIINIDLKVDNEGNSKGHGIVEFEHPVEAVQAISMFNGQKLFQRLMSVRMDRYDGDDDPRSNKLPSGLSGLGKGLGANGQAIHLSGLSGGLGMGGGGGSGGGGGGIPAASLGMMGGAGLGVNPIAAAAAAMSAGIGATGLGAMGLGSGFGTGLASGLGSGLGASGLTGGAGLNTGGLGLGLGNSNLGSAAERGLLGSSLGGSLGGGLSLGNSSLGLGSSGTSGLNFGLAGQGGNAGTGGLMSGASSLSNLGNSSALAAAMSNSGRSLGASAGAYGDFGAAYERATQGGGGLNSSGSGDNFGTTSSDTVQVRNLPTNYSWQNLRDRFRDVGDVRYTELKTRGTAFIRFNSERDAQRAVDLMHGTRIDGRPIEVRLY